MTVAKITIVRGIVTRILFKASHLASRLPWNRKGIIYRSARHIFDQILHALTPWLAATELVSVVTQDGLKMYLAPLQDGVSKSLLKGIHEIATTELLRQRLQKDMVVVDVGAHIGYFALLAARLVGEGGRVFAFEPVPATYQLLCKNINANNYRNIFPICKAAWSRSGTATLTVNPDSLESSFIGDRGYGKRVKVEVIRLDDFFSEYGGKVDFVKMDVEGAEPEVLDGMKGILANNPALAIVTEFCPAALRAMGTSPHSFVQTLEHAHGFTIEAVLDEERVEGVDFLAGMRDRDIVNLLLTRGGS